MLNPKKLQETVEVCRQILKDRQRFDNAERNYKLKIAANIAGALRAIENDAPLEEPLRKAFGSPNNLTSWQAHDDFQRWAASDPDQARRALEPFTRSDLSIEERVDRFFDQLPATAASGLGTRLMFASFFLFGSDPEHLVQYRKTPFDIAEPLLGWPAPAAGLSPGAIYRHHLAFVQRLESELREAGLDVRDALDAQSLLWWLTKGKEPECAAWRGEQIRDPRIERAMQDYEREMEGPLAAEMDRMRAEYGRMKPEFERLFGSREAIAQLQPADFFGFLNAIDARGQSGRGLFTMGIQLPFNPNTRSFRELEEDLPALRTALQELLHGDGNTAQRIDRARSGPRVRRYMAEGLGVPSVLLFFQDPDSSSGTIYMDRKEAKLRAAGALPELPRDASLGQRFAAYETALVGLPSKYGRDWDWAQLREFYWSSAFENNLEDDEVSDLNALVERFRAEQRYPTEANKADLAARGEFQAILAEDALDIIDFTRLKFIASSHKYGAPGPQAGFNRYINDSGDEGRNALRESIRYLLYGDGPLEVRVQDVLEGEHRVQNFGESVATKLLSVVHHDRVLPIFVTDGPKGKIALMRHPALGLPPSVEGNRGERSIRANDLLRERLEPLFGDDTYGMKEFLYWLKDQKMEEPEPEADGLTDLAERLLIDAAWLDEVIELLRERKQLIFYGPPGTGKTYIAREIMRHLAKDESRRAVVQFHPNYSYEDFIHGYRPVTGEDGSLAYKLKPGPLMRLAEAAQETGRVAEHVMIIDEINRGNLPKIFGELLYLLEYRDDEITLMYGEEDVPFSLPENLLIIGTMNTADRSVGLIDAALRRRFHFVPLFPGEYPLDGFLDRWLAAHHPEMRWVADVVERLNEKLRDRFGPHLQLGHSYFMKGELTEAGLRRIWRYNVVPFLEDQLFGQEEEFDLFTLDALRHELATDNPTERVPADA